jgi:hypothetical protein
LSRPDAAVRRRTPAVLIDLLDRLRRTPHYFGARRPARRVLFFSSSEAGYAAFCGTGGWAGGFVNFTALIVNIAARQIRRPTAGNARCSNSDNPRYSRGGLRGPWDCLGVRRPRGLVAHGVRIAVTLSGWCRTEPVFALDSPISPWSASVIPQVPRQGACPHRRARVPQGKPDCCLIWRRREGGGWQSLGRG